MGKKYTYKYCVINNKLLKIYSDSSLEILEAILDFDLLNCDISINESEFEFSLTIEGSNMFFTFKADSEDTFDWWIKEI